MQNSVLRAVTPGTALPENTAGTRPTSRLVRCGLLALGGLGVIGAAADLAGRGRPFEHLAPWAGVLLLAAAIALFAVPAGRSMTWVRVICLTVLCAAAFGVAEHLMAGSDPLGHGEGFDDYWASLSPLTRSWYGADDLGPGTPLTPGMLGQAALLLLLATLGGTRQAPTTV